MHRYNEIDKRVNIPGNEAPSAMPFAKIDNNSAKLAHGNVRRMPLKWSARASSK
jgi:hypothetical protein